MGNLTRGSNPSRSRPVLTVMAAGFLLVAIAGAAAALAVVLGRRRRTTSSAAIDVPSSRDVYVLRSVRVLRTAEDIADATSRPAFGAARVKSPAHRRGGAFGALQPKEAP